MSVKLIKRSSVLRNTLFFLLLSFVFYHITQALFAQISAVDTEFLLSNIRDSRLLIGLGLITFIQVWRAKRSSLLLMALLFAQIFLESFALFLVDFNKIILLLSFVYLIFAFYYFIFWKLELQDAIYHPRFSLNDIKLSSTYNVPVELHLKSGQTYTGAISNWDENSCFILLDEKWDEVSGKLLLKVQFEGHEFESFAQVVSSYGPGVGLKFKKPESEMNSTALGWADFYDIICDRGYGQNIS